MIRAGIVGATGYSGAELIRLLHNHPEVTVQHLYSSSSEGEFADFFPHLNTIELPRLEAIDAKQLASQNDVIFLATPAGVSAQLTPELLAYPVKVIDLSGDFRLHSGSLYQQWYKKTPARDEQLAQAVYGLPEWNKEAIATTQLLANPGCFPTATLLGILPLVKSGWVDVESLIFDAKSGVSGAGRGVSLGVHFSEVNENLSAYKIATHQHTPEIEQEVSKQAGTEVCISFTPHLIPMTRGILVTAYAKATAPISKQDLQSLYEEIYKNQPFVRVRNFGSYPKTKEVYGSNYCDIALHFDERTNRVIVVSVIDNVVKGAAGQAIQNMNIMFGMDETTGLTLTPVFP